MVKSINYSLILQQEQNYYVIGRDCSYCLNTYYQCKFKAYYQCFSSEDTWVGKLIRCPFRVIRIMTGARPFLLVLDL